MKKLTRDEMKMVTGGIKAVVTCNDGTTTPNTYGDCSCGSANMCDGHGGVDYCSNYPTAA